jgi:hypothetical protein
MNMEHWNETYRGQLKYSEKNMFQCHFVQFQSHMNWPGFKLGPAQ